MNMVTIRAKKIARIISLIVAIMICDASISDTWAANPQLSVLYPVNASATKYNKTIQISDLSGLPTFNASYDRQANKVIVRNGNNKLTLYANGKSYYKSGNKGRLRYEINAFVSNGIVTRIHYIEIEDNIKVEITYIIIIK